jgi:hypothetical protein
MPKILGSTNVGTVANQDSHWAKFLQWLGDEKLHLPTEASPVRFFGFEKFAAWLLLQQGIKSGLNYLSTVWGQRFKKFSTSAAAVGFGPGEAKSDPLARADATVGR